MGRSARDGHVAAWADAGIGLPDLDRFLDLFMLSEKHFRAAGIEIPRGPARDLHKRVREAATPEQVRGVAWSRPALQGWDPIEGRKQLADLARCAYLIGPLVSEDALRDVQPAGGFRERAIAVLRDGDREADRNPNKSEAAARHDFVDPLFVDVLDWPRKWLRPEKRLGAGLSDYVVEHYGIPTLIVEAKRPGKRLDDGVRKQVADYASEAGVAWTVTTNSREIAVYHRDAGSCPAFEIALTTLESGEVGLSDFDLRRLYLLSRDAVEHSLLRRAWFESGDRLFA